MGSFKVIDPKDIYKYIYDEEYIIIDIRNRERYNSGHIKNSINIPYERVEKEIVKYDRNKKYILYCERGGSSLILAQRLYEQGYHAISIIGGYAKLKLIDSKDM